MPGAVFTTDPAGAGPLELLDSRVQGAVTVLSFAGVHDRNAAESLRGALLLAEPALRSGGEPEDGWPLTDLVGLRAELVDGTPAGVVAGLERSPAHDLLVITEPSGGTALVPFVTALVPVVDVAGGRVVLDPPGGLLETAPPVDDPALADPAP